MAKPKRTFTGQEGQRSTGSAGPDAIRYDFDNLFAALDPSSNFQDGTQGGIGEENMKPGSITDDTIGNITVNQNLEATTNTGKLSRILSWLSNMVRKITGETNWFDPPATTLKATKTHIDASAPHAGHETPAGAQTKVNTHENKKTNPHNVTAEQVGALASINNVSNPGGNVTLEAGANVIIGQDNATKKITIATSGQIAPSPHASSHGTSGGDRITPAMIGAVATVSGKGLSTNDYTTAEKNKLAGVETGAQKNSSITKAEIEAKLTGTIASHNHAVSFPVTSVAGKTGAVTVTKADIGLGSVENYGIATKAQAEAGTANNVYMTPLRVAEALAKSGGVKTVTGTRVGPGTINLGFEPKVAFVGFLEADGDRSRTWVAYKIPDDFQSYSPFGASILASGLSIKAPSDTTIYYTCIS